MPSTTVKPPLKKKTKNWFSMRPGPHQNQGWGWRCKTGLSPPVKYFTDRSKAVLLLWIFYVLVLSCVCYVFLRVSLYVLCGHLLGKGWPLGSRLWCLAVSLSLSHWYPGSGVVLDCIDSWSLHPYLSFQDQLSLNAGQKYCRMLQRATICL